MNTKLMTCIDDEGGIEAARVAEEARDIQYAIDKIRDKFARVRQELGVPDGVAMNARLGTYSRAAVESVAANWEIVHDRQRREAKIVGTVMFGWDSATFESEWFPVLALAGVE